MLQELVSRSKDKALKNGAMRGIAMQFNVKQETVSHLWKQALKSKQNESAFYDNTLSALSGLFGRNYYVDPTTGQLQQQGDYFTNRGAYYRQQGSYGFVDQGRQFDPTGQSGFTQQELDAITRNNQNGSSFDNFLYNNITSHYYQNVNMYQNFKKM